MNIINSQNIINKKEYLKDIVEKYLQLQLLIKNFSKDAINFNKEVFDSSLDEIRLCFNKCVTSLDEAELKELISYFSNEYSRIKTEISKEQNDIVFIGSDNIFERIDNLDSYNHTCIEHSNKKFRCSFYFETIRRLEYHLNLKTNDIEHQSKII